MRYLFFDYECIDPNCGRIEEKFVHTSEVDTQKCSVCGKDAVKLPAAPRLDWKMGVDSAYGTLGDKWARMHEQKARQAAKKKESHGEE